MSDPKVVVSDPGIAIPTGTNYPVNRIGPQGDLVANMHGSLYEASRNGTLFYGGTQATGKITTVDLAATYTGLCLSNPAGNSKKLILRKAGAIIEVAGAGLSGMFLAGGYSVAGVVTHTTALVFGTDFGPLCLGSSAAPTALLDSAATIVNPRHLLPFAVSAATPGSAMYVLDTDGGVVILPGGWVAIATFIVTGAAGLFAAFWWEEVPLLP
jgi:hypothetical protein